MMQTFKRQPAGCIGAYSAQNEALYERAKHEAISHNVLHWLPSAPRYLYQAGRHSRADSV